MITKAISPTCPPGSMFTGRRWPLWIGFLLAFLTPLPATLYGQNPAGRHQLLILLCDNSQSDPYLKLDRTELADYLQTGALAGSIQLIGIRIQSQSHRQQPYYATLLRVDTLPVQGNYLDRARARKSNEQRREKLAQTARQVADTFLTEIVRPDTEAYTDVNGALRLARITAETPAFRHYDIRIIIMSDLLHDVKGNLNALQPVTFPPGARVYVIGGSPKVDLKTLFPANRVVELTSFKSSLLKN